jgi:hypothetical protein
MPQRVADAAKSERIAMPELTDNLLVSVHNRGGDDSPAAGILVDDDLVMVPAPPRFLLDVGVKVDVRISARRDGPTPAEAEQIAATRIATYATEDLKDQPVVAYLLLAWPSGLAGSLRRHDPGQADRRTPVAIGNGTEPALRPLDSDGDLWDVLERHGHLDPDYRRTVQSRLHHGPGSPVAATHVGHIFDSLPSILDRLCFPPIKPCHKPKIFGE